MKSKPFIIPGRLLELNGEISSSDGISWGAARTERGELGMFEAQGHFARRFARAASEKAASNLHVFPLGDRMMLVAFEENGRLIAVKMASWLAKTLLALIFLFGVATLPFLGAGLVILFLWWGLYKRSRPSAQMDRYLKSLHPIERVAV